MSVSTKIRGFRRGTAAAVAAVALALVGCGGGGTSSGGSAGSATEGDITWWGWTPDAANAQKLIDAFNEEYPDIKVTFVSKPIDSYDSVLGPAITSADGPDVFNVAPGSANGGVEVFEAGAVDLTDAVTDALGADWKDKLAPAGVEGLMVGDKVVGLSAGAVYSGNLWINLDMFEEVGIEPPTDLESWKAVCEALEAAGHGCFVQGAGQWAFNMDTFEAIMENIKPGAYVDASLGELSFSDPAFTQGMENWKALFDEGIMQEGAIGLQQYPDANNAFMSEQYGMVMMGSWYTQYAVKDAMIAAMEAAGVSDPEPFAIAPIPLPDLAGTGESGSMFGDADYGLAVSAASDQQAAATTFALWLTTSEAGQQAVADTLNDIPSLIGVTPNWDEIDLVDPEAQLELLQAYTETAGAGTQPRFRTVSPDLNSGYRDVLVGVVTGDFTIDEALAKLQGIVDAEQQ